MKHSKQKPEKPMHLKHKMMSALSMLLVSAILLSTTSYAWFVLSTAPEVTGISTNIGANGSLEIALLNAETHADLETIRSGAVGNSLAADDPSANYAWGNLIDLGFGDFGLDTILLMPARLNAVSTGEGYSVDSGMLAIPTYGYDGRVVELTDNTMSAVYTNKSFSLIAGQQDYGVRAIGTADDISAQGSALALAKSNISSYTNSAKTGVKSVMADAGNTLFNIVIAHSTNSEGTFGDSDLASIENILVKMQSNADYIGLSLRQGIVAYAASQIADEDIFNQVKDQVLNTNVALSTLLNTLEEQVTVPEEFAVWISAYEKLDNDVNAGINACRALSGGVYTWAEIRGILNYLTNLDYVYIGDKTFNNMSQDDMMAMMGGAVTMTLAPGSGIFADVADFIENCETVMTVMGTNVTVRTTSAQNPAYMIALANGIKDLASASGDTQVSAGLTLNSTYGYALDLGFRCNAINADLLLQTTPEQRVYESSEAASTQGGGSYMEFTSSDEGLSLEQRLKLMDAIRVGFLDDQNNILGIAKLNISNRSLVDDMINAPLYLYDYNFEEDASGRYLVMGERRLANNQITNLTQNVAKALTVVVWLDGDLVDNTMVSATEAASLSGVLNLQFSTSADLLPAENAELLNYTADKSGLIEMIQDNQETIDAGQGTYTNVSWNAFSTAFARAVAVRDSSDPSQTQVRNTMLILSKAVAELEEVSQQPVRDQIDALRTQMGSSDATAYYVVKDESGNYQAVGREDHTQEEHDNWNIVTNISGVDNSNNLNDEGNGLYTPIYTSESWNTLAAALYNAELVVTDENATDDQLNAALANLEEAKSALEREVFFKAYEYRGAIYYEAICDSDKADTYGKWYDSEFKRVINEVTILNLDAYATPAEIVDMDQTTYIDSSKGYIIPEISIRDGAFVELGNDEFKGVNWDTPDSELFQESLSARHIQALSDRLDMLKNAVMMETFEEEVLINGIPVKLSRITSKWPQHISQNLLIFTYYKDAVAMLHKAQNPAMYNDERTTVAEYEEMMAKLESAYTEVYNLYEQRYDKIYNTEHGVRPPMTSNTRILLTKAVGTANALIEAIREYESTMNPGENAPGETTPDESTPEETTPVESTPEEIIPGESTPEEIIPGESTPTEMDPVAPASEGDSEPVEPTEPFDSRLDDPDIVALMAALKEAEAALNASDTTEANATKKLKKLNEALTVAGSTPATEYNTATHKLPDTGMGDQVVYDSEYPEITMNLTGQTGSSTLNAQILTQNGVVTSIQKDIVVYKRAKGILFELNGNKYDPDNADHRPERGQGEEFTLTPIMNNVDDCGNWIDNIYGEQVDMRTVTWASTDTSLATVSKNDSGMGVVKLAEKNPEKNFDPAGQVVGISVSLDTVQGNTYATTFYIIIGGYEHADGIEILEKPNDYFAPTQLVKSNGASFNLSARLFYEEYQATQETDEKGNVTTIPGEIPEDAVLEQIASVNWSSSNQNLATVTAKANGSSSVKLAAGSNASGWMVMVNAEAKTVQNNTYRKSIPVIIDGYRAASGLEIVQDKVNDDFAATSLTQAAGTQFTLSSRLFFEGYRATLGTDEEGNEITIPAPKIPADLIVEKIDTSKVTWTSSDEEVATISTDANGDCIVTLAAASGQNVTINVKITTDQGNSYSCSIPVSVI